MLLALALVFETRIEQTDIGGGYFVLLFSDGKN